MLPIAHAGHWALWVLYAAPVIVIVASIVVGSLRERRERTGHGDAGATDREQPPVAPGAGGQP